MVFYDNASIYLSCCDVMFLERFSVHDTVDLMSALNSQSFTSELPAIPYSVFPFSLPLTICILLFTDHSNLLVHVKF